MSGVKVLGENWDQVLEQSDKNATTTEKRAVCRLSDPEVKRLQPFRGSHLNYEYRSQEEPVTCNMGQGCSIDDQIIVHKV